MTISEENQKRMQEGRMKSWKWWGRPAKYTDPEELEFQINDFFKWFEEDYNKVILHDKKWKEIGFEYKSLPNVSWLTRYLGFEDRNSLLDYCNRDDKKAQEDWEYWKEFSRIIKRAKTFIEEKLENRLAIGKGSAVGQIFILKNGFNWKDKTEAEVYGKGGEPLIPWTVSFIKPDPKDHEFNK